jgi:Ca2+/H+ antiporter, TMEM165/GDT1 family
MRHGIEILIKVVLFLFIAVVGFGEGVYHLWNWLMPALFRLPAISFWQGVGLLALSWLLFGGWRGFYGPGSGRRGHGRRRMLERWEQMTPEERDKFREGVRGRCGGASADARSKS